VVKEKNLNQCSSGHFQIKSSFLVAVVHADLKTGLNVAGVLSDVVDTAIIKIMGSGGDSPG